MKFPRRFEGSICGTGFLLRQPAWSWQHLNAHIGCIGGWTSNYRTVFLCPTRPATKSPCLHGAKFFTAAYPRQQADAVPTCHGPHSRPSAVVSDSSDAPAPKPTVPIRPSPPKSPPLSKKELLELVGTYNEDDTVEDHLRLIRDPYLRGYAPPNTKEVVVSARDEDALLPSFEEVTTPNKEERAILWKLWRAISQRRRNPTRVDAQHIYHLYCQLPEPRMTYLHSKFRHELLRSLSHGEKPTAKAMLRYFAVIRDVQSCGYALLPVEWNMAVHMATKHTGAVNEAQMESGLSIWRDMELQAGIPANDVTFNILFDSAAKAGNFALAEMVYKEMDSRGFSFNRYHHVTLIFFFGLKGESDGVRAAYREMVEAGEIIDTVVLNCLIAAFLRCGEENEAMELYERMKKSHADALTLPAQSPMTQKAVTRVLMMFTRVARKHPGMRPSMQAAAPLAPDLQTYRVLIRHFAVNVGRIDKVAQYLYEMKHFHIPIHGGIFLSLFKGFALHGSPAGSDWSPQRLFGVWEALLQALDSGADGLSVETWLAIWVLRAFEKCGQHRMMVDVFDELSSRWDLPADREEFMIRFLHGRMKHLGIEHDKGKQK